MSTDHGDEIKSAIQASVEEGWVVTHYVTVAAFERFADGEYMTALVLLMGQDQPDYVSDGLLNRGMKALDRVAE